MPYTPRSRDLFKNLSAVLTGVVAFATVTAAGTATGLAARETALRDQVREQEQARLDAAGREAAQRPQTAPVVIRQRPQRTVVHTRVIHAASGTGVTRVGPGGTISSSDTRSSANTSATPPTSARSAAPVPPPAAALAPVPAPSSGS